jgi:bifunctional non-homologous end joining protein LigD
LKQRTLAELARSFGDVQLATLVTRTPGGSWSYEFKWDGYRILALKSGERVSLFSRNRRDWTREFQRVADEVAELGPKECVLDGEVCALSEKGVPSFQLLQHRGPKTQLAYVVFDLLYLEGDDLRGLPIEERRAKLAKVVAPRLAAGRLSLSKAVAGMDEQTLLDLACRTGLEGIVAKKVGSTYEPGRSKTWLKIKCSHRQEFAIVGWVPFKETQPLVGALVLGLMEPDGVLHYAGKVGTGFDMKTREDLADLLAKDAADEPTAVDVPRLAGAVRFVRPRHVAEVAFTEWTEGGHVRHPSFQGLRRDKSPRECVRESPSRE